MLEIKELNKKYNKKLALKNLTLKFESGIVGLLGPNGAGKTTLMRCLATLITDYTGNIVYNDINFKDKEKIRPLIGYLPQNFSIFKELTVFEALVYLVILKTNKDDKNEVEFLIKRVNLTKEKDKKIKNLSGGMLRRVGIAQALIGDPTILIIDEPTAGLDPNERIRLRNILATLSNKLIIISTHIVEDLSTIANDIAIIKDGNLLKYDKTENIINASSDKVYEVTIDKDSLAYYENEFKIISTHRQGNKFVLRIISDIMPKNGVLVPSTIEDSYFYLVGETNEI